MDGRCVLLPWAWQTISEYWQTTTRHDLVRHALTKPFEAGEAVDFFERYLGIGGGDGFLEALFLVVLGMVVLVTMSSFVTKK